MPVPSKASTSVLLFSLAGGGTGVTGSTFAGNPELTIPSESVLQFTLSQPLRPNTENHQPTGGSQQE